MIIRGLDSNQDWTFGTNINAYKIQNDAITQDIQTKLKEWKGECFFAMNDGIDYINTIGYNNLETLEQGIYSLILKVDGVVAVNQLTLSYLNRNLVVNYDIQTVYTQSVIDSAQNTI